MSWRSAAASIRTQDQHREVVVVQEEQPKSWDEFYPTQSLRIVSSNEIRGYGPTYARGDFDQGPEQGEANL